MKRLREVLNIKDAKILDIGTGIGNFIYTLTHLTDNYSEIIGIDTSEKAIEMAKKNLKDERINFVRMDALNMTYEDNSFDIVCLSNSLHHLKDVSETIKEMERVVKPDGILLFNEMYSDVLEEKQKTHVELHHFWAEIDRLNSVIHNETMTRKEILHTLESNSSLNISEAWDTIYETEYEFTNEQIEGLKKTLDDSLKRVSDDKDNYYKNKAIILKERLDEVGFKGATQLLVVMK